MKKTSLDSLPLTELLSLYLPLPFDSSIIEIRGPAKKGWGNTEIPVITHI